MEKFSCTDRVKNEEFLHRGKEEMNMQHTIMRRMANFPVYILSRSSLLKHVIEGKIEGRIELTESRERGRKQVLDDLKKTREY